MARDRRRATPQEIVARSQAARAQAVGVPQKDRSLVLKVTEAELSEDLKTDSVAVHLHGHGDYKGRYWLLRRKAGRGEKRQTLAQGTPEKLAELCERLGYQLCLDHRKVGCDEHEKAG